MGLKSNQVIVEYPQDTSVTIAPLEYLFMLAIVVLHLDKTIGCFSPLAVWITPFATERASPQGGGFYVISWLI